MKEMNIPILVLDDDLDDLQMMQDYFAEVKLDATFTSDLQALLDMIKPETPYIIITDYHLKGNGTGVQAIKAVMQMQKVIAPIFISGYKNPNQLLDIISLHTGCYYVEKGPNIGWFRELIKVVYGAKADLEMKIMKAHMMQERDEQLKQTAQRILEKIEKKEK